MSNIYKVFNRENLENLCGGPGKQGISRIDDNGNPASIITDGHAILVIHAVHPENCIDFCGHIKPLAPARAATDLKPLRDDFKQSLGVAAYYLSCFDCEGEGETECECCGSWVNCKACGGQGGRPSTGKENDLLRPAFIDGVGFNLNLLANFLAPFKPENNTVGGIYPTGFCGRLLYLMGSVSGIKWELAAMEYTKSKPEEVWPSLDIFVDELPTEANPAPFNEGSTI